MSAIVRVKVYRILHFSTGSLTETPAKAAFRRRIHMARRLLLLCLMATDEIVHEHLCYLNTGKLEAPLFEPLDVLTRSDIKLGTFDGVVVDPAARCVRYLVIDRGRFFHERRLIPLMSARVDAKHHALRLEVDNVDPSEWLMFDRQRYPPFSDEDLITAMFAR